MGGCIYRVSWCWKWAALTWQHSASGTELKRLLWYNQQLHCVHILYLRCGFRSNTYVFYLQDA